MARRDGSAARRWDPPPEDEPPEEPAAHVDPSQLVLDPLLDDDLRRLQDDFAFGRALVAAMVAHEPIAVRQLLANPAALRLPRTVREEAQLFASLSRSSLRAPMQALRHHARLAHLLAQRLGVSVERVLRTGW